MQVHIFALISLHIFLLLPIKARFCIVVTMGVLTLVPVAVTCESHLDHHPLTVGLTIFLVLLLSDGVDDAELLAVL